MHCTDFLLFFYCYISLPVGGVAALKIKNTKKPLRSGEEISDICTAQQKLLTYRLNYVCDASYSRQYESSHEVWCGMSVAYRSTCWPTIDNQSWWIYQQTYQLSVSWHIGRDMLTDTSQSTYRLTLDWYDSWHICWHSADMSTDTSVDMTINISVKGCIEYTWSLKATYMWYVTLLPKSFKCLLNFSTLLACLLMNCVYHLQAWAP